MDSTWVGALVSASSIIVLFAAIGFNRPSWSRTYTTAARYRAALAGHLLLYLLVLVLIYAVLRRGLVAHAAVEASTWQEASTLIWVALALALGVRAVPALSARMRTWVHRMAGIPGYAQRLAARLADADFEATPSATRIARDMLVSRGVDADCDDFPIAQPAHRLLLKATSLFIQLRHWENKPRFSRFVLEAKNDFDILRRRFDRLSFSVSRTLALIERLGEVRHVYSQGAVAPGASDELDALLKKMAGDLIADSCEDINAFYDDACLLAARGVLATRSTRKGRDTAIAQLGFELKIQPAPTLFRILGYTAVLVPLEMFVFFRVVQVRGSDLGTIGLAIVVSLIVYGTMVIAIVPKLRWGFANAGLHARTPVPFVVGAGVCAVGWAVAVDLGVGAMLGGVPGALRRLHHGSPYLLGIFLTAVAIAWLVQDHRWRGTPSPWRRRLRDAGAFGSLWLLSSIVGGLLRIPILGESMAPPLEMLGSAVGSLLLGGVVGYAIPEFVRVTHMRSFYEQTVTSAEPTPANNRPVVSPVAS